MVEAQKVLLYHETELHGWTCKYLRDVIKEKVGLAKKTDVPKYFVEGVLHKEGIKTVVIHDYAKTLIERMELLGKYGNASAYDQAIKALDTYGKANGSISISEINGFFLEQMRLNMIENGMRDSARSTYFRSLKAIINKAIKEHQLDRSANYGFANFKIDAVQPTKKRALSLEDITKLLTVDLVEHPTLIPIQEYAVVLFNMHGMNFMDLAFLKMSNITGDFERIHYRRKKTRQQFDISIEGRAIEIFKKHAQGKTKGSDELVFPVIPLDRVGQGKRERTIYESRRRSTNRGLSKIAELCGIEQGCSTYTIRHTFATTLKKRGVDEAFISEFLGHQSVETTRIYLDSFDEDKKDVITKSVAFN